MKHIIACSGVGVAFVLACVSTAALAQNAPASAGVAASAGGAATIEQGDVGVGSGATASGSGAASTPSASTPSASMPAYTPADPGPEAPSESSGTRLGVQVRINALNILGADESLQLVTPIATGIGPTVPLVTPGVRFVDGKLFLGLGLGLVGGHNDCTGGGCGGGGGGGGAVKRGQSGFSLSPLVSYDLMADAVAAFSLVGWLNIASQGEQQTCNAAGVCADNANSDADGLGLNLAAGVRGKLSEGLAIGGEFGWGFMSGSVGPADYFNHGLFGTLLFEASVGL